MFGALKITIGKMRAEFKGLRVRRGLPALKVLWVLKERTAIKA